MAKEGILLDQEGNEIPTRPLQQTKKISFGPVVGPLVGAAFIAMIAFAGVTIFGALLILFVAFWTLKTILSIFGFNRHRKSGTVVYYSVRKGR